MTAATPTSVLFQAFCISTASRVGVGNIAGIAIAIMTGGPGAIFWMWVIAVIGAASGFTESTLAQIYKVRDPKTFGFRGGPAYYIRNCLGSRKAAALFAVLISVTFGLCFNSVQSNTIAISLNTTFGVDRALVGLFLTVLAAVVIFGGLQRIAHLSSWLVPIMASLYLLLALVIVVLNITHIPAMFASIISQAFSPDAAVGGIGAAILTGAKRGLFSNEAGMGSVPNAAATAFVSHPVKQGLVQALGVFVDTLLVCTASACIVLLFDGYADSGKNRHRTRAARPCPASGRLCRRSALRHGVHVRLQLHCRQLLLRRKQHSVLQHEARLSAGVPHSRGGHGGLRLRGRTALRVEPRRPLHGPHGHREPCGQSPCSAATPSSRSRTIRIRKRPAWPTPCSIPKSSSTAAASKPGTTTSRPLPFSFPAGDPSGRLFFSVPPLPGNGLTTAPALKYFFRIIHCPKTHAPHAQRARCHEERLPDESHPSGVQPLRLILRRQRHDRSSRSGKPAGDICSDSVGNSPFPEAQSSR